MQNVELSTLFFLAAYIIFLQHEDRLSHLFSHLFWCSYFQQHKDIEPSALFSLGYMYLSMQKNVIVQKILARSCTSTITLSFVSRFLTPPPLVRHSSLFIYRLYPPPTWCRLQFRATNAHVVAWLPGLCVPSGVTMHSRACGLSSTFLNLTTDIDSSHLFK